MRHDERAHPIHTGGTAGVREQLEATTRVLASAHAANLNEAVTSVRWERRGVLKRLVRRPPR